MDGVVETGPVGLRDLLRVMVTPGDEWWDDLGDYPVELTGLEVEYTPLEPLELFGPDGELLARVWPRIGYLAD